MNRNRQEKGITLIALVITIIILLILAGVVLNLTLGEHGILKKAEQAGEQYKISEILEKLELEKVDLMLRKNGEVPSLQEYVDHLINKGIISESDVEDIDDNTKNITVAGYVFTIVEDTNRDITISYQGKADNSPRIAKLQVTKTSINSISVTVLSSNANGASYKYSIKNITLGETEFTEVTTLNTNEYTFTGLTINNEYVIQVELVTSKGSDIKETESIKTEPPKVTSITLDKTNIELTKGGTDLVTATVLPEEAIDKTITWASSNGDVVTVDNEGNITAIGEGVAMITATATDGSGISASCNITVTLPPPPTIGAGETAHTAKQIQYTWEELNSIAKVMSDNYGTGEGQVNNDTAEVVVSINGKTDTLGIGDWTTVNGLRVRILGFNHDTLASTEAYREGETNTYAGISFEYVDYIIGPVRMNSSRTAAGGWGVCELRGILNSTTYDSLENKEYVKEVIKQYISTPNNAGSVKTSTDKLWLLSCSEIWNNGYTSGAYGYAITKEGEQYKFHKNINAGCDDVNYYLVKRSSSSWWLRSPYYNNNGMFGVVDTDGSVKGKYANNATSYVAPGFAI